MTKADIRTILKLDDARTPVAAIAAALNLTPGRVYAVLREHRPDRQRTPRERTSDKRRAIEGLLELKFKPSRIAALLSVKRQYVYRIQGEARAQPC